MQEVVGLRRRAKQEVCGLQAQPSLSLWEVS